MDVQTMPAGLALDRLIAEKVMAWTWCGTINRTQGQGGPCAAYSVGDDRAGLRWFMPSSHIAHAWEVVERMLPREARIIYSADHALWLVNFDNQPMNQVDPSAPLAICRAALQAVVAR